jgi:hypothetical protein
MLALAGCSFNPSTITVDQPNRTAAITVITTAPGTIARSSLPNNFREWLPTDMIPLAFVLCGFVSAGLSTHQRRWRAARIVVAFATVAAVAECGGAGVSTGGENGGNGGAPMGTTGRVVTLTDLAGTATHSLVFTINVQ